MKNMRNMKKRSATKEGEERREEHAKYFGDIIQNESYADSTVKDRYIA